METVFCEHNDKEITLPCLGMVSSCPAVDNTCLRQPSHRCKANKNVKELMLIPIWVIKDAR